MAKKKKERKEKKNTIKSLSKRTQLYTVTWPQETKHKPWHTQ